MDLLSILQKIEIELKLKGFSKEIIRMYKFYCKRFFSLIGKEIVCNVVTYDTTLKNHISDFLVCVK